MADTMPKCADCGLPYGDDHWIEWGIPQDAWERIAPANDGNGLLCIGCGAARLRAEGMQDVPVALFAGCYDLSECPTCPTLRAEVSRLTAERDAAVRKLEKLNRLHSGAWSCEDAQHTAKYYASGIEHILNGDDTREGE